jgi:transcriptional regulator with XRE-family HTH domain
MEQKIGEIIKRRVHITGMSKAELARRLHMSPANVHKIFKRSSVDADLLRNISNILDYDFFQHFEPEVKRHKERHILDIDDTQVLFIRYVVDLQTRVKLLEEHMERFRSSGKPEENSPTPD